MRESDRGSVISLDGSAFLRLFMTEVFQTVANRDPILAIEIKGTRFGFGRTANDDFDNGTKNVDGAVVVSRGRILGRAWVTIEKEFSASCGTRKTTDEEVREKTVQNRQRNQKGLVSSIEWCKLGAN